MSSGDLPLAFLTPETMQRTGLTSLGSEYSLSTFCAPGTRTKARNRHQTSNGHTDVPEGLELGLLCYSNRAYGWLT